MSRDAVVHSLSVAVDRERAFEVWVDHIDLWWPKPGHTRSRDPDTTICLEREAGGRFFERTADGREFLWGAVEAWEPPGRIAFTWHMNTESKDATQVEVTFTESGPRSTHVEVRHSAGRMAETDWAGMRDAFQRGFSAAIRAYQGAIENEGGLP